MVPAAPVVMAELLVAFRVKPPFNAVILELRVMVLAAVSVNVLEEVQLSGLLAASVMVPALPPVVPLFVVVITILLVARSLSNVVVLMVAVGAAEFGSNVLLTFVYPVSLPVLIVTFAGSSNQVPIVPFAAAKSIWAPSTTR